MTAVVFACGQCGQPITIALQLLPANASVNLADRQPAVPRGTYAEEFPDGERGCALVHLDDLVGVKQHPDRSRLNGCCGLDGVDGPNVVCGAGHEVAIEQSDCWMPHGAVLLPNVTRRPAPDST